MRKLRQLCTDQPLHLQIASACRLARCRRHIFGKVDCILAIEGIDSRFNAGCREMVEWLFPRATGGNVEVRGDIPEETLEDVVTVILPDQVHVICSPAAFYSRFSQISSVPNLHIHKLDDAQWENAEAIDDFKLNTLMRIFDTLPSACVVGVPYFPVNKTRSDAERGEFSAMLIEKWPLIQAFAAGVDQGGAGEFFTLSRSIVELSDALEPLYVSYLDDADLRRFEQQFAQLDRHVSEMIRSLDRQVAQHVKVKVGELLEPLTSYSQVPAGTLGRVTPLIAFGARETAIAVGEFFERAISVKLVECDQSQPIDLGQDNYVPLVYVATMPAGLRNIVCARTYFVAEEDERDREQQSSNRTMSRVDAYSELVSAVQVAINVYSRNCDYEDARQHFSQRLQHVAEKLRCEAQLVIVAVDKSGRVDRLGERLEQKDGQRLTMNSKTAFGVLSGCHDGDGRSFGTLLYADTFIHTPFDWLAKDGDGARPITDYAVLTRRIQVLHVAHTGSVSPREPAATRQIDDVVVEHISCEVFVVADEFETTPQSERSQLALLKCVTERDVFAETRVGGGMLRLRPADVERVLFVDGESTDAPCAIAVRLSASSLATLRSALAIGFGLSATSGGAHLLIVLRNQTSQLKRLLFGALFGNWRSGALHDLFRVVTTLDGEPPLLAATFLRACAAGSVGGLLDEQINCRRVLSEAVLSLGATPRLSQAESDAFYFTVQRKSPAISAYRTLLITVMHGFAGSYKRELCDLFPRLSSDAESWSVFYVFANHTKRFRGHDEPGSVRKQLEQAIQLANRLSRFADDRTTSRMLLCVRGAASMPLVSAELDALAAELDQRDTSSMRLRIASYVHVLNPTGCQLDGVHRPFLLDNCRPHVCDAFVFTGDAPGTDIERKRVDALTFVLKKLNPRAFIMNAPRGRLQTEKDLARLCAVRDMPSDEASTESGEDSNASNAEPGRAALRAHFLAKMLAINSVVPARTQGENDLSKLPSPFRVDFLTFRFPTAFALRRSALSSLLEALRIADSNDSAFGALSSRRGTVLHVSGMVQCVDGSNGDAPRLFVLNHVINNQLGQPTLTECELVAEGTIQLQELTFVGIKLQSNVLLEDVHHCIEQPSAPKPLMQRADLTQEDLQRIEQQSRLRELPEGWFFNGTYFLNMEGEKRKAHPNLDLFIEDHLRKLNEKIEAANLSLVRSAPLDFDKTVSVEVC